jgi:four helix bundle protein
MDRRELEERTKAFALRVMKLADALPKTRSASAVAQQLVRSGTSVAANYRAATRARSRAEFIAKLGVVVEEADETTFWMELIADGNFLPRARVEALHAEAIELLSIFARSRSTARSRFPLPAPTSNRPVAKSPNLAAPPSQ